MPKFHVDEVYPKGEVYPVLLNFQNGYLTDKFESKDCLFLENKINGQKRIAVDVDGMVYMGDEVQEYLSRTLIMARNKNTGKIRLIEVGQVDLKSVFKSKLDKEEVAETSYLELSRKFGSKKHRQIMEHREKLKLSVTNVTEQMESITNSITEEQLDLSSYSKQNTDDFYIPVINREATNIEDIYVTDKILTEEQYEKIYTEIENSDYTKDLNPFLKSLTTTSLSKVHSVLLIYTNTLLKLYATLMKDIAKKNYVACQHSVTLNEIVMKNFLNNVNGKYGRPPQYKDKALCHALVFMLLINDYKFNFDDLCQQLKLTPRTVTSKVALTGATLVNSGTKKVAQLKLPLNKPALRRRSTKF